VRFSPTGRSWAAASTEGLLLYSLDHAVTFDPFDLDIDITPESTLETLAEKEYLRALVMAFRLNEAPLLRQVWTALPASDIRLLVRELPQAYLERLLRFVAKQTGDGPHVELGLRWIEALMIEHGKYLKENSGECAAALREAQKALKDAEGQVARM
jgi:periodic tryptophan protein 2